ncbi:MAG TPA: hypothetical protein VNI57_11700 [Candidatus Saccharimonadales bacterium]|nr:hypothetical protein [Candidatus Saccharimonadales bacterium]
MAGLDGARGITGEMDLALLRQPAVAAIHASPGTYVAGELRFECMIGMPARTAAERTRRSSRSSPDVASGRCTP